MDYKYFTFGAYKTRERAEVRRDLVEAEVRRLKDDLEVFYDAENDLFVVETLSRWPESLLTDILQRLSIDFFTSQKRTGFHLAHKGSVIHVADETDALFFIRQTPAFVESKTKEITIREEEKFIVYQVKGENDPYYLLLGECKQANSLLFYFSELKNVHTQAKALESILDRVDFEDESLVAIVARLQHNCYFRFTADGEYYGAL